MHPRQVEQQRMLSLGHELDTSMELLEAGLGILQHSRMYNARRAIFLQLLSGGIERLLKIILILRSRAVNQRPLTTKELKGLGHNINELHSQVIQQCFTDEYLGRPIAQWDLDFMNNDPMLTEALDILSDFGMFGRYAYMDATSDPAKLGNAPDRRWDSLEMDQIDSGEFHTSDDQALKKKMTQPLVTCLERYIRAQTRIMTHAISDESKSMTSGIIFGKFRGLDDNNLGTTTYEFDVG
jgi:hypothetical protein